MEPHKDSCLVMNQTPGFIKQSPSTLSSWHLYRVPMPIGWTQMPGNDSFYHRATVSPQVKIKHHHIVPILGTG